MNNKEYLVTLKNGTTAIMKFTHKTIETFFDDNDFILFENGFIRKDEIVSVIAINNTIKFDDSKIDEVISITQETSKIIGDSMKPIKERLIDINRGITIGSGSQGFKLINGDIKFFEIKDDGTIIVKVPKINFMNC